MFISKNTKALTLTASRNLALSTLLQALRIYFGQEIVLVGNVDYDPSAIRKFKDGSQTTTITVVTHFIAIGEVDAPAVRVFAEVRMDKRADENAQWKVDLLSIGTGEFNGPKTMTWYVARVVGHEEVLPTIKVIIEMGKEPCDNVWRVGRTLADRHLEPLFPQSSK